LSDSTENSPPLTTRITSKAQVLFCKGCCCGRTDCGLPEVPVDRLKAVWKAEKLNRGVQLTISGCLGPCDLPNVAVVITTEGMFWYGLLDGDAHYDAFIEWARARVSEGTAITLPRALESYRIQRF